jgi:hypothetical protein
LDIENNKKICTVCCELQVLIAYVERLVQLFLQVKENIKMALSSREIVNWFYGDEAIRYVEQIKESPLQFEADVLCFGKFLNS